ncbi:MAG: sulfite exporter TauE/SafE family protein [Dehalococcoidia bacterium]
MPADILAAAVAIAFLAALCMSVTGFGFALTMAPLLTLAWDVKQAVAATVVLSLMTVLPNLLQVREHVVPGRVFVMLAGYLLGLPLGVLLLERLGSDSLKIFVASTVLVASVIAYASPALHIGRNANFWGVTAGVASGALGPSTSMNGPPVVLYLLGLDSHVERFRGTILAYFFPAGVLTVTALAIAGRITGDTLLVAAVAIPALVAGTVAGSWLRKRLDPNRFRTLVLAVLIVSSAAVLLSAIG